MLWKQIPALDNRACCKKQINEIYDILSCNTDSSENKTYLFMRAVLSPPEPDGQILYRPYMDSYKRTPKTEVCQVLFACLLYTSDAADE